jgi:2-C-methyl-D-erythritol 4-phosphate cytidylyltransferase
MAHHFGIVIPAAGSGKRFGGGDKLLTPLGARTVLQRSVALFAMRPDVTHLVLVTAPDRFETYRQHLTPVLAHDRPANLPPLQLTFAAGGRERWESVLFGLRALPANVKYVGIHDAARPLTSPAVIDAAFAGAIRVGGSVPCLPEPATLKRVAGTGDAARVAATIDRSTLFQAQTPQCFDRALLIATYEQLIARGQTAGITDDAQVFEQAGHPVAATPGAADNLKITTAEDVALARALIALL